MGAGSAFNCSLSISIQIQLSKLIGEQHRPAPSATVYNFIILSSATFQNYVIFLYFSFLLFSPSSFSLSARGEHYSSYYQSKDKFGVICTAIN